MEHPAFNRKRRKLFLPDEEFPNRA